MRRGAPRADLDAMTTMAGNLGDGRFPHSARLERLLLMPAFPTARERLDDALGRELAQFLVAALCADGQGRVGSSSP
jgi:hypothetical protein